jgi:hypothetical protein
MTAAGIVEIKWMDTAIKDMKDVKIVNKTMHPIMQYLEDNNNEQELFEKLLEEVMDSPEKAKVTAAEIQAIRRIRFDLLKLVKENE